jgi:hypothetical protein
MFDERQAMNEAEWASWTDPDTVLDFIRGPKSSMNRPVVAKDLWACACCRRIGHLFHDAGCFSAILAAEGFADGDLSYKDLRAIAKDGSKWHSESYYTTAAESVRAFVTQACSHLVEGADSAFDEMETPFLVPAHDATRWAVAAIWKNSGERAADRERLEQCSILRDILGNPFCPVLCLAEWQSSAVTALANEIYNDRRFCDLPRLATALIAAGCDNVDILGHCESEQPHFRGCWVVDMFLQRSFPMRWS